MRCIRTVKALRALEGSDMHVVALYTDVDRDAPFVRHADMAFRLPVADARAVAAYLDHDAAARDAAQTRRRRGVARLGLRRRVARVRRPADAAGHSLPRPDRRHDARARRQDRVEAARRARRRAGHRRGAAARSRRRGSRAALGRAHRLPARGQGVGRRRWPRHPRRREAVASCASAFRVARLRGAQRVRRRPPVPREDGHRRPPHRGADRRRPARLRASRSAAATARCSAGTRR